MGIGNILEEVIDDFLPNSNTPINNGGVLPASQDPLGDPADQQRGVLPASQDPLGDPADQERGVLPASRDPRGDPADQ